MAYLFHPNGKVETQPKLHLTPTEIKEWGMAPGESIQVFETKKGTIAILTCYDIEFPEVVRKVVGSVQILFSVHHVPMIVMGFIVFATHAMQERLKIKFM